MTLHDRNAPSHPTGIALFRNMLCRSEWR